MNKLKLLVLAVLAAAMVVTGALAAAPPASAAPSLQARKGKTASKPLPLIRVRFDTVLIT